MSQHSAASTATTTGATTPVNGNEESLLQPVSSLTGSLKKQKNKNSELALTDDFVLMSAPEKFKDKNVNDCTVVKRQRSDSSPNEKINLECLYLADTSVQCAPIHVQTLFQHFVNCELSQAEKLFLLVYIVALESGYVCQTVYDETKMYLDDLTATCSFHAKNCLRLARVKPSYQAATEKKRLTLKLRTLIDLHEDDESETNDLIFSRLTGFVTGDLLIVTLTPANSIKAKGFSTALSIGRYVLFVQPKDKPLYQRFHKLDELTNILRDQLFVPMRCQQLNLLECGIFPSLAGLPVELYDNIFKYLSKNHLNILANVNRSLYDLVKSKKLKQKSKESLEKVKK